VSRVKKLRVGAALIGVTATAMLAAITPASATDAVTGKLDPAKDQVGLTVDMGGFGKVSAKLFGFKVGDSTLSTYCVDIETPVVSLDHPGYVEADWNKHPKEGSSFKKNSAFINWVLHHGYPKVDADKLAEAVTGEFKDKLSKEEAITATQAAIWTFSDGVKLNSENPTPENKESAADVLKVYNYLIGEKNTGMSTEPKPVLTLEPNKLTGKADSLIGPFVVTTTSASGVTIAAKLPDGVIFSDKDGKELAKAEVATKIQQLDKYEFYVKVPASVATGKVEFTVAGDTEYSLGRLFISKDATKKTQSMILATTKTVKLEKQGTAEWGTPATTTPTSNAPAPQPKNTNNELANTGASILTPILIGVVLVGAGVGALVFQRRRRA
jgi:TQXA domain-containing protein/LPXTG-motif cell wall-anchored protein